MSKNNDDNSNNTTNEKPFDEDTINKLIKAIKEEDIPFSIKENESDNKDYFDDSDDFDEPLPKKHTRKKISSEKKSELFPTDEMLPQKLPIIPLAGRPIIPIK